MEKEYLKVAISISCVSKRFRKEQKKQNTIREKVLYFFKKNEATYLQALNNVSVDIYKGEFFGIIGKNGSGKSTLLKIILGTFKSDGEGSVVSEGKIIRLALGLGFDPNLSVRDNIYVNGSILGLSFKEIGNKFEEIVEFAELPNFVDTPIKFLSSGMRSKLAFSISMFVNADILLIDEFFGGVGDISFKNKSEEIFKNRILHGRTIVFISHNLNLIRKYCDRAMVLNAGKVVKIGDAKEMADFYEKEFNGLKNRN